MDVSIVHPVAPAGYDKLPQSPPATAPSSEGANSLCPSGTSGKGKKSVRRQRGWRKDNQKKTARLTNPWICNLAVIFMLCQISFTLGKAIMIT